MDKSRVDVQLESLEQLLDREFNNFREVYNENVNTSKVLSNDEIYRILLEERLQFVREVNDIRRKILALMHEIQENYDDEIYKKLMASMKIKF